ncbi:hypothetical protein [Nocardioides convexus]|uniref:hypothetical protein n=1 Tax=Nocardioides convexus TaxID=2712224 RepID=UPI0024188026|nr:hypothetical protein [Nocardioides convexus]
MLAAGHHQQVQAGDRAQRMGTAQRVHRVEVGDRFGGQQPDVGAGHAAVGAVVVDLADDGDVERAASGADQDADDSHGAILSIPDVLATGSRGRGALD